jgi:CRISPR/Cas system-associated endonuclease Cas1
LGIWHTDERHRDSLALDVMEAARPTVDEYVLDILTRTTFQARDFHETGRGICRILAPLTHHLAEAIPAFAAAVVLVAQMLASYWFYPYVCWWLPAVMIALFVPRAASAAVVEAPIPQS